jgi:hypothetical protein
MTSDRRRDSLIQRAAESLRGSHPAERLGTALAGLARELADARRQIAILRSENATRRAQLEVRGIEVEASRTAQPTNLLYPRAGFGDSRRG